MINAGALKENLIIFFINKKSNNYSFLDAISIDGIIGWQIFRPSVKKADFHLLNLLTLNPELNKKKK